MKKNLLALLLISASAMNSLAQDAPIDLYRAGVATQVTEVYDTPLHSTNGNQAVLTEVTTGTPYEGTTHFQIEYISNNWWAGNGAFNLNNYGFGSKQNYSNHTHLRVAFKGTGNAANSLYFWLTDSTLTAPSTYRNGPEVLVSGLSANYQLIDLPLSSFVGTSGLDLTNVHTLNWRIGVGAQITSGTFYIDNIQIVDLAPTGIADKFESLNVSIGPNPSSGIYTINSQENIDAVIVTDQLGNVLSNNTDLEIDLTNQADGLYFVTIFSDEKRAVKKLVKK